VGVRIRAGHVGDRTSLHHRLRDAALLRAIPDGRVAGATLMVGIEPAGDAGDARDVFDGANAAAKIADVDRLAAAFGHDVVPLVPDLQQPGHVDVVILAIQRIARLRALRRHATDPIAIHALAALAITHRQRPGAGPAVGEEAIHLIPL